MTLIEALKLAAQHYLAGRPAETATMCRAILAAVPDQAETFHLLGVAEHALGHKDTADARFRQALALRPDFADAYGNLAVVLMAMGQHRAAVASNSRAMVILRLAGYLLNRGSGLVALGDQEGAIRDFLEAIRLAPNEAGPPNSLGSLLRERGQLASAILLHRRALALNPAHIDAWRDLAHAQREGGNMAESARAYARAFTLAPERTEMLSYHLFDMQAMCDWNGFDDMCRRIADIIDQDRGIVLPLASLSIETTPEQQLRSAVRFYHSIVRGQHGSGRPFVPRPPSADGRLRIAYFSADYYEHATAYLAAEMFELHDRDRYQIFAYSFGPDDGSPMRRRLIQAFDGFREIRKVGVDRVLEMTAADGIDIMVDLKGYTKQSRLDLLAQRFAPVQATYLGYPGTSGCEVFDYVIGDRFVTPLEHEPFFSEKLVVMPDSYQVNDRRRPLDGRVPTRAECGLPEDGVVFSAFNTTYKLSPMMFGAWMRLLGRLPGSILWLFQANADVVDNLRRAAAARGIDPERLVFAPKRPLADHLARYRVADLALDSFPYTGHTTTSDALWMGLPVVTLMGGTFASRVAAGLLSAAGVPELITETLDDYEALALRLVQDRDALAALRRRLEETRLKVPLFDSLRFTRHIERAYDIMWDVHRSGQAPRSFAVPPLPA